MFSKGHKEESSNRMEKMVMLQIYNTPAGVM